MISARFTYDGGHFFHRYRNLHHVARVRLVFSNGVLTVWVDLMHTGHFQRCITTAEGDSRLAYVPSKGYFGLSASNGAYGDAHVVYAADLAHLGEPGDRVDPIATADPAATVDAAHEVHAEATDHLTNVP